MKYQIRLIEENNSGKIVRNKTLMKTNYHERAINGFNKQITLHSWIENGNNRIELLDKEQNIHRRYEF